MKTHFQADSRDYYTGPIECPPNPEEPGKYWVPFGAYEDEPMPAGPFQIQKRIGGAGGSWVLVPNYSGFEYWTPDRVKHVITEPEVEPPEGYLTEDPGPTPAQIAAQLKREAQALLDKSDQTVGRCYEGGVPVPEDWKVYRAELRAIVSTGLGSLPNRPEYPAGT